MLTQNNSDQSNGLKLYWNYYIQINETLKKSHSQPFLSVLNKPRSQHCELLWVFAFSVAAIPNKSNSEYGNHKAEPVNLPLAGLINLNWIFYFKNILQISAFLCKELWNKTVVKCVQFGKTLNIILSFRFPLHPHGLGFNMLVGWGRWEGGQCLWEKDISYLNHILILRL